MNTMQRTVLSVLLAALALAFLPVAALAQGPSRELSGESASVAGRPRALGLVVGQATVAPTCPVQRIDTPCPDAPWRGTVVVRNDAGAEVARTNTGPQGHFHFVLEPGHYHLITLTVGRFPSSAEADITVLAGHVQFVHLQLDSGIR